MPTQEEIAAMPLTYMVFVQLLSHKEKGKKVYRWQKLKDLDENDGRELVVERYYWTGKRGGNIVKGVQPGAIYSFPTAEDGSMFTGNNARYVGMWKNQEQIAKWKALHRAATLGFKMQARAAREMKEDLGLDALAPIAAAYWQANMYQRQMILAHVLAYITGDYSGRG